MSEAGVGIKFTGETAALERALLLAERQLEKMREKMGAITKESREAARAEEQMGRAARQVEESVRTPQEQHLARLKLLRGLYDQQKIGIDTYGRAVDQANEKLRGTGKRLGAVAASNEASFGAKAAGWIENYVTRLASIATVAALATAAIKELSAAKEEAASKARESEMALGELKQVAIDESGKPSQAKYAQLTAAARDMYAKGGAASLSESARTIYRLQSAEALDFKDTFGELYTSGMVHDPAEMAKSAKQLIAAMGKKETGSFRDIISKSLAASAFTPARAEQILQGAAVSGAGARALGLTDEEIIAGTAIVSEATGSADVAGTQIRSLMHSLRKMGAGQTGGSTEEGPGETLAEAFKGVEVRGKKGKAQPLAFDFAGKSLMEMLEQVEAAKLNDAQLFKLFGSCGKPHYGRRQWRRGPVASARGSCQRRSGYPATAG